MKVTPGPFSGLLVIEPSVFGDSRGFFMELWSEGRYRDAGLEAGFVQDNLSLSARGTLRGLHFQNPRPQGKLVTVLEGEVYDVVADLRRGSSTFGRTFGLPPPPENKVQFYVPPGFAHGFVVVSDRALFHYKVTSPYSPADEVTVRWDDPDLGIDWPVDAPLLSARDAAAPRLRDLNPDKLFA